MCDEVYVNEVNYLKEIPYDVLIDVTAKFRYRQIDVNVQIKRNKDNSISCYSPNLLKAVTNGQIACFYDLDGRLIVAGIIDKIFKNGKEVKLN